MADELRPQTARLKAKVVPGSSRNGIVGWLGDALKIKVAAPPEKGRANEAVVAILAERLGVRRDDVQIIAGHSAATKEVAIAGLDDDAIKKALS